MTRPFLAATIAALLPAVVAAPACAADVAIEQVAPRNAVLTLGIRNVERALERSPDHPLLSAFRGGGLPVAELLGDLVPPALGRVVQAATGGDGNLPRPTGAVGASMYVAMDPELGLPRPAVLVLADYGDGAAQVGAAVTQAIEEAKAGGSVQVETTTLRGRTVHAVRLPEPEPADDPMNDPMAWDPDAEPSLFDFLPDVDTLLGGIDTVQIVQTGSVLLLATDIHGLDDALASLDGDARDVLSSNPDFESMQRQVGANDLYAAMLTRNLGQVAAAADPMGMMMMFAPILRSAFGEVRGFAWGMEVAAPGTESTQRVGVLMPGAKRGLSALLDTPGAVQPPPAFVGSGTTSYASYGVEFAGIDEVLQRLMQENPLLQMQAGPQWVEMRPRVAALVDTLGGHVHMASAAGDDPDASPSPLLAVECADAAGFEKALLAMGDPASFRKREVAGRPVYTRPVDPMAMPMMMGMPIAEPNIGIGADYVFIGDAAQVDAAMGAAPEQALRDTAAFHRAIAALGDDTPVAWGFSDLARAGNAAAGANRLGFDPGAIMSSLGPTVWALHATDDGFVATVHQLPAAKAAGAE